MGLDYGNIVLCCWQMLCGSQYPAVLLHGLFVLAGVQQPQVISTALAIRTASGQPLFDCVQATWNLLEQSAGKTRLLLCKPASLATAANG